MTTSFPPVVWLSFSKSSRVLRLAAALLLARGLAFAADPGFSVTPDRETGVYAPGEKVTWTVDFKGDRAGLTLLPYSVKKDALGEVCSGTLDLSSGPVTITASRGEPGALLAEIKSPDKSKPLPLAMGGAVISPEKIGPVKPAPADFDAFWQAKLKELAAVAPNPQVEPLSTAAIKNGDGTDLYRVTLNNIHGTQVRALLSRPTQGGKFPALVMVNSAGVYALDQRATVAQAKQGWLVLNVNAHDLPVDESDAFYKEQKENALKDYIYIGNESRETSYFVRMFLGCVRGAEYLASRPDWNGQVLVVAGASQGGLQAFATAALCPKITAVQAQVPAGCDVYGPLGNPARNFGWPYWLSNWGPKGRDIAKIQETAGYFDAIYFASRVRCPALVGVALLDLAARPAGVIAAYNALGQPKELIIMPMADHYGSGGTQNAYFAQAQKWKDALKKGSPLPISAQK